MTDKIYSIVFGENSDGEFYARRRTMGAHLEIVNKGGRAGFETKVLEDRTGLRVSMDLELWDGPDSQATKLIVSNMRVHDVDSRYVMRDVPLDEVTVGGVSFSEGREGVINDPAAYERARPIFDKVAQEITEMHGRKVFLPGERPEVRHAAPAGAAPRR
jgi:hypothetical protein